MNNDDLRTQFERNYARFVQGELGSQAMSFENMLVALKEDRKGNSYGDPSTSSHWSGYQLAQRHIHAQYQDSEQYLALMGLEEVEKLLEVAHKRHRTLTEGEKVEVWLVYVPDFEGFATKSYVSSMDWLIEAANLSKQKDLRLDLKVRSVERWPAEAEELLERHGNRRPEDFIAEFT